MGRKKRAPEGLSPATRVVIRIAILVGLAFIPTCASMGVFPAATRVAAPLVCPADTDHSVVTSRWGGGTRGGKSLKWDLYCMTSDGFGTIPSTGKLVLGLLAVWSGVVLIIGLGFRVKRRLLTDRKAPANA